MAPFCPLLPKLIILKIRHHFQSLYDATTPQERGTARLADLQQYFFISSQKCGFLGLDTAYILLVMLLVGKLIRLQMQSVFNKEICPFPMDPLPISFA